MKKHKERTEKQIAESILKWQIAFPRSPVFWREKAEHLVYSARILLDDVESNQEHPFYAANSGVGMTIDMLIAMAIECELKAATLAINLGKVGNVSGVPLAKQYAGHDLVRYATEIGIVLDENDVLELRRLTVLIQRGRYPYITVKRGPGEPDMIDASASTCGADSLKMFERLSEMSAILVREFDADWVSPAHLWSGQLSVLR